MSRVPGTILIVAFSVVGSLPGLKAQEKLTLKATPVLRAKSGDTVEIQT